MKLAIDVGNTRTKIWLRNDERQQDYVFRTDQFGVEIRNIVREMDREQRLSVGWLSSARPIGIEQMPVWEHFFLPVKFFPIKGDQELPIKNAYATPNTLGSDRIVVALAACSKSPGKPVLVIDAGTTVTYDFADTEMTYHGGAISPGLHMRFQALNEYTARLPLLKPEGIPPLVGKSTVGSIQSGVINGMIAEMNGTIARYRERFGPELVVYLTGGDHVLFENQLEYATFAVSDLVLEGIMIVLESRLSA